MTVLVGVDKELLAEEGLAIRKTRELDSWDLSGKCRRQDLRKKSETCISACVIELMKLMTRALHRSAYWSYCHVPQYMIELLPNFIFQLSCSSLRSRPGATGHLFAPIPP